MADALQLSLSTAKRLLNRDDLSLETILKICQWLNVDFYKLVDMTKSSGVEWEYFTKEQEHFFAHNLRHYKFMKLLLRGMTLQSIMAKEKISEKKARSYVTDLIKLDLIENQPVTVDAPVSCKIGPRPDFHQYGEMWHAVLSDMVGHYLANYFATGPTRKFTQFEYGQRSLTMTSYKAFCREIDDLYKKYVIISQVETETHSPEELEQMTFFCVVDRIWVDWLETIPLSESR